MEKIIKDFIKSDLDEAEFFGVSKENSVLLEDYLSKMKDRDFKFHKIAKSEIESIKRKCDWVKDVNYDIYGRSYDELTLIYFNTPNGCQLHAYQVIGEDGFTLYTAEPERYILYSKRHAEDRKRMKDLLTIQTELEEIKKIGESVYGRDITEKHSVSENFDANYRPEIGLLVHNNNDLLTAYPTNQLFKSDLRRDCYYGEHPIIKSDSKDNTRLLRKILIKK